ncbi:MAG: hypothetical protein GFH27_549281n409 [Chloroflexi bacterium AL-W]|nr:hypothetical protein [Chloroflexi bacterium AL-N1]NOK66295.1 hypothetical protein [Chloroflexi bacterium AL-N10]NOK73175.1 hypothetical protein [Chloroflexi bacterium AL-N5]NOK80072.1 hypothetical protein [Chloroflexi bacterium AL-W]NOK88073.1 hypothetical protein [Chloroflexi bacterium AL-N15]
MNDDRKRRQTNWGSMIGWLIFLIAIAGTPILNGINQIIGGSFRLPGNLLPFILFGLLALSIVIPIVRSIGGAARSSGDTRLPTSSNPSSRTPSTAQSPFDRTSSRTPATFDSTTSRPPTTPKPPFGNSTATARSTNTMTRRSNSQMPSTPRFEPIINPTILAIGIVGVLVFIGLAFVVLSMPMP